MRKIKDKKINVTEKTVRIMAAAALSAVLLAGQIYPVAGADNSYGVEISSLIPDNVTIEEPMPLGEIGLPGNEYGTLTWGDDSYVPTERTQSCEVIFHPYDSAKLSGVSGWDSESGVITGYVTVVVNSLGYEESQEDEEYEESQDNENYDEKQEDSESVPAEDAADDQTTNTDEKKEETKVDGEQTDGEKPVDDELTVTPEAAEEIKISVTPELTEEPQITEKPETSEKPEISEEPENPVSPETTQAPEKETNIFDEPEEILKDENRPLQAEDSLTEEEKQQEAEMNHSYNGIYVSGINLPWYVQFRVASGDSYKFTNESDAVIFQSYEFELWDLQNDTEYHIPDGEYISVTVPVKEGYDYTIEHLLDNGAMETIVPSVVGDTMVFSTHSFSPFGIAGSKPLVGSELSEDNYADNTSGTSEEQTAVTPAVTVAAGTQTTDSEVSNTSDLSDTSSTAADSSTSSDNSTQTDTQSTQSQKTSSETVNTGDTTPILPLVILALAAAAAIGIVLFLRKKK